MDRGRDRVRVRVRFRVRVRVRFMIRCSCWTVPGFDIETSSLTTPVRVSVWVEVKGKVLS
jgi:hypothetical protein